MPLAALNGWGAGKRGAEWSRYDSRAEQCEGERAKEGRSEQRKEGAKWTPLPVGCWERMDAVAIRALGVDGDTIDC